MAGRMNMCRSTRYPLPFRRITVFCTANFQNRSPDTVVAAEMTNSVSPVHIVGLLTTLATEQ